MMMKMMMKMTCWSCSVHTVCKIMMTVTWVELWPDGAALYICDNLYDEGLAPCGGGYDEGLVKYNVDLVLNE